MQHFWVKKTTELFKMNNISVDTRLTYLILSCFFFSGFAGEDWLHTWCNNRSEEVWGSPTRIGPVWATAHHWYRGTHALLLPNLAWTWYFQVLHGVHMMKLLNLCSNFGYTDSLPLRADWIPYFSGPLCIVVTSYEHLSSFSPNLTDICRQNPQRPIWGRAGSAVWESRPHLGPASDDGSSQWPEQRLCLCHFLH